MTNRVVLVLTLSVATGVCRKATAQIGIHAPTLRLGDTSFISPLGSPTRSFPLQAPAPSGAARHPTTAANRCPMPVFAPDTVHDGMPIVRPDATTESHMPVMRSTCVNSLDRSNRPR